MKRFAWLKWARVAALVLCAAVAAYAATLIIVARPAFWIAERATAVLPSWLCLFVGIALIDFGKLVGLLPAAWLLRRTAEGSPIGLAIALVTTCFALELVVMALLQHANWNWQSPAIWIMRLLVASLLVWPTARVLSSSRPQATERPRMC